MSKLGRNDPCWCGSGKKFKKCHWPQTADSGGSETLSEALGPIGESALKQTLRLGPPKKDVNAILAKIQEQKQKGTRPLPSSTLISLGNLPTLEERVFLLDTCARLVDQNWAGRHEMCVYFAVLVRHGLHLLGYSATVEFGKAIYSMADQKFELEHAWVLTEFGDVVDGNADSLIENPFFPEGIQPQPYWGPPSMRDREFHKLREMPPEKDESELDIEVIRQWKADLERGITEYKRLKSG